jgi:hypothetical protein
MDTKNKNLIPLVIIFFLLGIAAGYAVHMPGTVEKVVYINNTVVKTVEVTAVPTPTTFPTTQPTIPLTPIATPVTPDFIAKYYDPTTDKPSQTIELANYRMNPDTLRIRLEDTVLIKITDTSIQNSIVLSIKSPNTTYERNLGTSGTVYVTFNKKGNYNLAADIPSGDPNIIPRSYGTGTLTVY